MRVYQTIGWRVRPSIYLGLGYKLDWLSSIVDYKLDTARPLLTSRYMCSKEYGFSTDNYIISGLGFNATYDSRDNLVNPCKSAEIQGYLLWRF